MTETNKDAIGSIKISDEVIASYVSQITLGIDGVCELSAGFTDISKSILRLESQTKGIKLSREEDELIIDVYIIIEYKVHIPQLSWEIQSKVRDEIKEFTGQNVKEVNIHVQGVNFTGEEK